MVRKILEGSRLHSAGLCQNLECMWWPSKHLQMLVYPTTPAGFAAVVDHIHIGHLSQQLQRSHKSRYHQEADAAFGKSSELKSEALDMLRYLIDSMEKQHMWFANYKGRKENVMNLVFHFNTQTDALNNIELAADMKKDSTSMNAIAGLTMIFLPGTFTAFVLSSGIFESTPGQSSFQTTGLWWLWITTTLPTTTITVLCWWMYKKHKLKSMKPVQLSLERDTDEKPIEARRKSSTTTALRDLVSNSDRKASFA